MEKITDFKALFKSFFGTSEVDILSTNYIEETDEISKEVKEELKRAEKENNKRAKEFMEKYKAVPVKKKSKKSSKISVKTNGYKDREIKKQEEKERE